MTLMQTPLRTLTFACTLGIGGTLLMGSTPGNPNLSNHIAVPSSVSSSASLNAFYAEGPGADPGEDYYQKVREKRWMEEHPGENFSN